MYSSDSGVHTYFAVEIFNTGSLNTKDQTNVGHNSDIFLYTTVAESIRPIIV